MLKKIAWEDREGDGKDWKETDCEVIEEEENAMEGSAVGR